MVIQEERTSVLKIQGNFNMEKGPNQRAKRKTKLQVLITIPFFPASEPWPLTPSQWESYRKSKGKGECDWNTKYYSGISHVVCEVDFTSCKTTGTPEGPFYTYGYFRQAFTKRPPQSSWLQVLHTSLLNPPHHCVGVSCGYLSYIHICTRILCDSFLKRDIILRIPQINIHFVKIDLKL